MRDKHGDITPICDIQGETMWSPLADRVVTTKGVITAIARRGFFLQSTHRGPNPRASDAVFVFSPGWPAIKGALVKVTGKVLDFIQGDYGKPVTQIKLADATVLERRGPQIIPRLLTAQNIPTDNAELAEFLNGLEGMLVSIEAGHTFIAPSNPYGDYVLTLDADGDQSGCLRTAEGGMLVDQNNPLRWFPGFRIPDYSKTIALNVGATLLSRIVGPMHYRVESFQIRVDHSIRVADTDHPLSQSQLQPEPGFLTILTMNGFNLDSHIESASRVKSAHQDIDDDWGDGRFHSLARAIVKQAHCPDIVALQEIQDNDGAEMTDVTDADETYASLIQAIGEVGGPKYHWVDIAPGLGADGGQPGGSIRNAYLYRPERVELDRESVRTIGATEAAFEGSRKPLVASFREKGSDKALVCINVHLASKRHQRSIFAPEQPGFDPRNPVRVEQAQILRRELLLLKNAGVNYYVTGDFNDTEESDTLKAITGDESINLVNTLEPEQRFDYNHRGKLQALMHGIVPKTLADSGSEYEIIHGNELIGVQPGQLGSKPSDHAYVIAKLKV